MELRQLRYFLALARTGSFSKAAAECHVCQPSLSQQILNLEKELGEPLFDRRRPQALLTPAGTVLANSAARILAEVEGAQRDVKDASGQVRGMVLLGSLPTIAPYMLPDMMSSFAKKFPAVQMQIHEDITAQLVRMTESSELDLALIVLPVASERVEQVPLFQEELLVALAPDHPFARKRKIAVNDLRQERFILMKEGHCLGSLALDFCKQHDFHPQISCRSAQIETIVALVDAGLGVSPIPRMACNTVRQRQAVYRPLAEPRPTRTIGVIWPKDRRRSRAALELFYHVREKAEYFRAANDAR